MKTAQKNFRRLVRYLKSRDDIEITTFRSLMNLYSNQKEFWTAKELGEIAENALAKKMIVPGENFSPAEAFLGLARTIADYQKTGFLPQNLKAVRPLGPTEMPISQPETTRVKLKDVYELARTAHDHIDRNGSLPSFLTIGNSRIGTGSLYALFSAVYLDMRAHQVRPEYAVPSFDAYPKTYEKDIVHRIEGLKSWPVHRRDLDMTRIIEMTRIQLWTLKPAQKKSRTLLNF